MTTHDHPSIQLEERWHRILEIHGDDPLRLCQHILTDLLLDATKGWREAHQDGDRTADLLQEATRELLTNDHHEGA